MSRWFFWLILFVIGIGLLLHFQVELPWFFNWIGNLPGDLIIKKGSLTIYLPFTTSLILSVVVSIFFSFIFGSKE